MTPLIPHRLPLSLPFYIPRIKTEYCPIPSGWEGRVGGRVLIPWWFSLSVSSREALSVWHQLPEWRLSHLHTPPELIVNKLLKELRVAGNENKHCWFFVTVQRLDWAMIIQWYSQYWKINPQSRSCHCMLLSPALVVSLAGCPLSLSAFSISLSLHCYLSQPFSYVAPILPC